MCEYCSDSEIWGEPLKADRGERVECEWLPDDPDEVDFELGDDPDDIFDAPPSCEKLATLLVFDRSTEDHLCVHHLREERQELEEGLGDFLKELDLEQSAEFVSINAEVECDFMGSLLSESVRRCGGPATVVKVVVTESMLCARHARESGYTRKGSKTS